MKEAIREMALALGADVCGFAAVDRFADAPSGFSPLDLYDRCETVIVFGVALPGGLREVAPRLLYHHSNEGVLAPMIDAIALRLAKAVECDFDCRAVPLPCDSPYEYWDADMREGRGLMSMKHAAVLAGLGTLGKSTLLINKRFGGMLNLGAVLTDAAIPSDPLAEIVCIDGCTKCVDSCPAGAIQNGRVIQALCRDYAYTKKTARGYDTTMCNLCRMVCPMAFGQQI